MKPGKPHDVAHDAVHVRRFGKLPKWYDITANQAKRVWRHLRRMNVNDLGVTQDPNGGFWVREYDKEKRK